MSTPYSPAWRRAVREGAQASAKVLAPYLLDVARPRSVVDVGCGEGWLVDEIRGRGVHATGVDGAWTGAPIHADFARPPYPLLGPYDLAVCLEVAEHVPVEHAATFVAWLCDLAPVCIFSAARPGQGGEGHVNEQPAGYWRALFAKHGREGSGQLRWPIWDDDRISWWYRQNLLIFAEHLPVTVDDCPDVVHPGMLAWKGWG